VLARRELQDNGKIEASKVSGNQRPDALARSSPIGQDMTFIAGGIDGWNG
jgi:hypothetical protein